MSSSKSATVKIRFAVYGPLFQMVARIGPVFQEVSS